MSIEKIIKKGYYSDISFLNRGGSSYIFKAKQSYTNRYVVIKTPIPSAKKTSKLKIYNEANILSSINHTNIVSFIDSQEFNNSSLFIMEFLDGYTLHDYIKINGPLDINRAKPIIKQLCSAILYLHNNDIVHRDIKPSNIIITKNDNIKLIDFGMSIHPNVKYTHNKQYLLGTIDYSPPELLRNSNAKNKSLDIYSLGATIYYIFFGSTIYCDNDIYTKIRKKFYGFYPKFNFVNENISDLLNSMLTRNPLRRNDINKIINKLNLIDILLSYNPC